MPRLISLMCGGALVLGIALSAACSFNPSTQCTLDEGAATVSSPSGVYGPPGIDAVNHMYRATFTCQQLSAGTVTATASYNPTTGSAVEEIVATGFNLHTAWTCNNDPWLTADVSCSLIEWGQREGSVPSNWVFDKTRPLSAQEFSVEQRGQIFVKLLSDYTSKVQQFPNICTGSASEFASIVIAPSADQELANASAVPLNVRRSANCSAAIDGVQPRFALEWQVQDLSTGQWSDIAVVPTFDGVANPDGTTLAQSLFPAEGDGIVPTTFRARARLTGTANPAPWSEYVQFSIDPF